MTGPSNNDSNSKKNNNSSIDITTPPAAPFKKPKITKASTATSTTTKTAATMSTKSEKDAQTEQDEFEIVKVYLLNCPLVGSDSPAIKAALEGIEKEEKRRIRDEKLRSKFAGTKSKTSATPNDDDGDELVVIEKDDVDTSGQPVIVDAPGSSSSSHENDDMEWQDVQQQQKEEDRMVPAVRAIDESFMMGDSKDEDSFLGQTLATGVMERIARNTAKPVKASTPLVAVIVALHAALRSDELGFACMGIAEEPKNDKGKLSLGFAPPIRELPRNQFLPQKYDSKPQKWPTPLRYRKNDTGAMILRVEGHPSSDDDPEQLTECRVTFAPTNSKDDPTQHPCLKFPVSEHINTDSWKAAQAKIAPSHQIPPSLHYKNLPGLLSKFCRTFDLGAVRNDSVKDTTNNSSSNNNKSSSSNYPADSAGIRLMADYPSAMASNPLSRSAMELRGPGYEVPSTVGEAFPAAATAARDPLRMMPSRGRDRPHLGDFSGDLLPSGMVHPGQQPLNTGNLMGPNHPMFARGPGGMPGMGGVGGIPLGGPGTMQPRFDPTMPPGIGGDMPGLPSNPGEGRRRRMPGEPNPDHLRPPNSFGSHSMFM